MTKATILALSTLVVIVVEKAADKPKDGPGALEQKLHGEWKGPACGGNWTIKADGTFAARHYSPGNNHLTGTWMILWNVLPPTLVLTMKTSDAPDRIRIGETWKVKLTRLDDEALTYEWPSSPGQPTVWDRVRK